jgi:hypothetical protein
MEASNPTITHLLNLPHRLLLFKQYLRNKAILHKKDLSRKERLETKKIFSVWVHDSWKKVGN